METKKILPTWLSVVLMLLIVAALAVNLNTAADALERGVLPAILTGLYCLAYVAALFYCFAGYKKNSAPFFRFTSTLYMILNLLALCVRSTNGEEVTAVTVVLVVITAISFGIMCIFSVAENLGRKKSYILAGLNLFCAALHIAFTLPKGLLVTANIFGEILLAVVFGIMVYAKYQDKAARGRT